MLGRYDITAVREWHNALERWYADQTVSLGFGSYTTNIKPIQISRTFDRVVNEGMEMIAASVVGEGFIGFPYRSIGDGGVVEVLPSDTILSNEVNRIDITQNIEGGSISRDGTTIYSIGNHPKSVASSTITECGMHNTDSPTTDIMFDHSMFETPVPHIANADAIGSTTVIYMCSA